MPEFLLASEYEKSGTLPECRPSMPLSSGPILFCASSPMEWQGSYNQRPHYQFSLSPIVPVAPQAASNLHRSRSSGRSAVCQRPK
jgi:hypothetical protein